MLDSRRTLMADYTTLSLQVQLNAGDMYRYSLTTIFRRFRWVVLLFSTLAVYLAFQISRGNFQWSWSFGNVFAPLFFFIFFPYAFFIAPYFSSKKYLQKNPNLAGPKTYTFSVDGIDVSGAEGEPPQLGSNRRGSRDVFSVPSLSANRCSISNSQARAPGTGAIIRVPRIDKRQGKESTTTQLRAITAACGR